MKICPNCNKKYFDDEAYYCFKCNYRLKHIEETNFDEKPKPHEPANISQTSKPTPKCPTCGSTRVKKLDVFDRGVSIALFTFASNKIGKSFQCKDCKHTW